MEVLHEHEETIHAGGDRASAGKPVHAVRDRRHDFLHPRLQGGVLGFERGYNTTKRIRREAKSLKGLYEGAWGGVRLQKEITLTDSPSDEAARRMQREILCHQQQMAFLKKS